jgi:DNA primase catalytic core
MHLKDLTGAIDLVKSKISLLELVKLHTGEEGKIQGLNVSFCCPFHSENDPSFKVNTAGEINEHFFYCFGCKRGGSILDFVQFSDGVEVVEATQLLAERNGIDLTPFLDTSQDPRHSFYSQIYRAVVDVCHEALLGDMGGSSVFMTDGRKINIETLKAFKIGYTMSTQWLHESVNKKLGVTVSYSDLKEIDLCNPMMWDNAVVFPVFNNSGHPTQFYTRPFSGSIKYVGSSSSSALYSEDSVYGLHLARKELRNNNYKLNVVEGQIDLLQMYSHGFKNTVATCGLSKFMSAPFVNAIAKYKTNEVVLIPDGDDAGKRELIKIAEDFTAFGSIFVAFVVLQNGDPDEILKEFGASGISNCIGNSVHPIHFYIDNSYHANAGLSDEIKFLDVVCKYINKFSTVYREMASKYIETKYGIHNALDYFTTYSTNPRDIHDKESESTIIKLMIEDKEFAYSVRHEIGEHEFYVRNNADLYKTINACLTKYGTVSEEILMSVLKKPIQQYWSTLQKFNLDVEFCIQQVKELYMRRSASRVAAKLLAESMDTDKPVDMIMQEHRAAIVEINDRRNTMTTSSAQDLADRFSELYIERSQSGKTILGTPLSNRWATLNTAWSGLELGYVHMVAAHTGVGKTSVAVNWFNDVITLAQEPALFISAEMSKDDIWTRMMSIHCGLSNTSIRLGKYPPNSIEWETMMESFKVLRAAPGYVIVPNNFTISEIMGIIEYHRLKFGCKHVFIDYVQLIKADNRIGKKWEVLDVASSLLQNRAMNGRDPMCIVTVAQQNKDKSEMFGSVEGVGGAYKLSQDAAKVVILTEKSRDEINRFGGKRGNVTMNIDKVRMGPSGIIVDVMYDKDPNLGSLKAGEAANWEGEINIAQEIIPTYV